MGEGELDLMTDQTCQTFDSLLSGLPGEEAILLDQMKEEILANISEYAKMTDFLKPIKKVESIFFKKAAHYPQDDQVILKRALVAKLALYLPHLLNKMDLPASILEVYSDAFGRLADFLKSAGNDPYDATGDFFCKDIRFVLGLSIPNGTCVFDMISCIAIPSVILSGFRSGRMAEVVRYFRAGGPVPWFRAHIDSRYLTEVNEQGWDNFFLRLAELLERRKDIRGYVGTTWLYDPQLPKISPRLSYWQKYPRIGGAFLLKHGTQSSDIEYALKTSETRRSLYREGKYIPICYSMVWPRKELISWARQSRTFPSHD